MKRPAKLDPSEIETRLAKLPGWTLKKGALCRTFTFEEALDMKLINEIYDKDEYWDNVMTYAKQFCPPNKASKAVGLIKRSVQSGSEMAFQDSLALERELQQQLFQSGDAKEGIAAYVEKRQAKFEGK